MTNHHPYKYCKLCWQIFPTILTTILPHPYKLSTQFWKYFNILKNIYIIHTNIFHHPDNLVYDSKRLVRDKKYPHNAWVWLNALLQLFLYYLILTCFVNKPECLDTPPNWGEPILWFPGRMCNEPSIILNIMDLLGGKFWGKRSAAYSSGSYYWIPLLHKQTNKRHWGKTFISTKMGHEYNKQEMPQNSLLPCQIVTSQKQ